MTAGSTMFQLRRRELLLAALLVVAVFNFTTGLFSAESIESEAPWRKAIKDLPVAAVLLTAIVLRLRAGPRAWSNPIPRSFWVALGLLLAYMAIHFLARHPSESGFLISLRYYLGYPVLAWAIWALGLTRPELLRLTGGLVALGALQGVIATIEFAGVIPATFYGGAVLGGRFPRAIGTLGNPNNLAIFLALPALLLVAGAYRARARSWILLALIFVGMALTFSKAVGLGLLVAAVVVGRARAASGSGWRRGGLLLVCGAIALTALSIAGRFRSNIDSLLNRTEAAQAAWDQWTTNLQSFLFGDGFGSLATARDGQVESQAIDNMILALGVEGGLLGLVLFGVMVLAAFLGAARARRRHPGDPLAIGLQAYLVFFLLYSPFAVNFRLFPGALFYWAGIGLLLSSVAAAPRLLSPQAPARPLPDQGERSRRR